MITKEMLEAAPATCGYVWASPDGQWLTFHEQTTHTGTHKRLGVTTDINRAYVGWRLPRFNESDEGVPHHSKFTPINATKQSLRVVRITPPTVSTNPTPENPANVEFGELSTK